VSDASDTTFTESAIAATAAIAGALGRLRLERPVIVLDLETTGVDPRSDRILEISVMKIFPADAGGDAPEPEVKTKRVNPGVPIPPGATAVHGITDADVAAEPAFAQLAKSMLAFFDGSDFIGFGVRRFDLPLLEAEFKRAGHKFDWRARHVVDAKEIFHSREPRTLSAAYALYCGGELQSAHTAEADMLATRDVLIGQLDRYDDLPCEIALLARVGAPEADPDAYDGQGKLKWMGEEVVINFGKSRGKALRELATSDRGLLAWILRGDFEDDVKTCVRAALDGRFPVRTER
jgi:DNA polymerase-3 subunit epsilon